MYFITATCVAAVLKLGDRQAASSVIFVLPYNEGWHSARVELRVLIFHVGPTMCSHGALSHYESCQQRWSYRRCVSPWGSVYVGICPLAELQRNYWDAVNPFLCRNCVPGTRSTGNWFPFRIVCLFFYLCLSLVLRFTLLHSFRFFSFSYLLLLSLSPSHRLFIPFSVRHFLFISLCFICLFPFYFFTYAVCLRKYCTVENEKDVENLADLHVSSTTECLIECVGKYWCEIVKSRSRNFDGFTLSGSSEFDFF
jgi:hypothetical protein